MAEDITPNSNKTNIPVPFRFDDPRQKSVYERLGRLVSPSAAAFYKDACRHMVTNPLFASTTHIVGHLLREVESALRDVLESLTGPIQKTKKSDGHENEISAILGALGFNEADFVGKEWLKITGEDALHSRAHRRNLDSVRIVDKEFLDFLGQMDAILDAVLDKFESQYTKIFDALNSLVKKEKPTKADAQIFHLHIPNNLVTHSRFFEGLSNSEWLPLLNDEGVFLDPPKSENNLDDGSVRYPPWPAAVYLEKMAPVNPDLVITILEKIKDTDNVSVKNSLLMIGVALPADKKKSIVNKAKEWMNIPHRIYIHDASCKFIIKLVDEKLTDSAFNLVEDVLEVLPDPKSENKPADVKYIPNYDPRTKLDHWQYGEFIKKDFQRFIELDAKKSFDIVCRLLSNFEKFKYLYHENHNFEDYSYISRPAIEDHAQNHDHDDIESSLITAIRDIGLKIIEKEPSMVPTLLSELEERKWSIFRRIGLYILSEYPESAKDLVSRYLTDKSLFADSNFKHEQARLMNRGFRLLSSVQQKTILDWIELGDEIIERIERRKEDMTVNEEQEQKFKEVWQRDQLSCIKEDLPDEWKNRYSDFIKKYGQPEHPDFPYWSSGVWVGPTSEVHAKELVDMDIEKIIELLNTWQPKEESHGFGSTKEGLGRELGAAIKLKPDKFKDIPEKFKDSDPTYIRAFIQAFYELAQNGCELNWSEMIELCSWVMQQPREIPGRLGEIMDQDPDWGWTRKSISSLISRGANSNSIPYELREKAWEIIEPSTHDPDPTPEDEAKHEEHSDDAYAHAINCSRGEAMNAVVEYALWVYRNVEESSEGKEKVKMGFGIMPEVKTVLEWHLDPNNDPSTAVRSIYGRFFPWLLLIDKKWTLENIKHIFPMGQFNDRLYGAAWNTFMLYASAYNDPFDVLKDQYHEAIKNLGNIDKSRQRYTDRDERVAEHLMLFYCRGRLELQDGLLNDFWVKASDNLRGHAIGFIGRSLNSDNEIPDPKLLDRMKTLWENRMAVAKSAINKSDYVEEMSAFGWWFASGKFEDKWSNEQYLDVLDIGKNMQSDYHVMKRLIETVKVFPLEAVKILGKLVLANQPGWMIFGNKDEINTILTTALQSPDVVAKEEAKGLINRLVARGYADYSSLLPNFINSGKNSGTL